MDIHNTRLYRAWDLVDVAKKRGLPAAKGFTLNTNDAGEQVVRLSYAVDMAVDAAFNSYASPISYPADSPQCRTSLLQQQASRAEGERNASQQVSPGVRRAINLTLDR